MKLLYRYYYTFFLMHHYFKPVLRKGQSPPWFDTLLQISLGIFCWLFGIGYLLAHHLGFTAKMSSPLKRLILLGLGLLIMGLHYLLFNLYGVDKQTGLTEQDYFVVSKRAQVLAWLFWVGSFVLCALVPFLRDRLAQ
ncbi:hypothetical protein [Spirosoma endbachense]|uniref:Uncharacterized protein n=1 Tax=Spirosoma endbachense TaxID=2666025 RepID=A0A6P1VXX5_9BACT|nr:hypothetical protein [Spirosoma endbachense]QHV96559.1 hypothetical protein GJR95_16745 [Spirosoma endbachense]